MQDYFKYDALTFRAPQRTHWYTRLWPACLGHGCFSRKRPQFQLYLIGYDPVGQLQRAASVGDVALVQKFINGSEYHINDFDRRQRTSLHYACAHNHPNVVAWLVSNDCTDINGQDDEGSTPLIKATQRDSVECVSILLIQGANPHIIDFGGKAALHHAVVRGNITIAGKLLKYKANIDAKTKYGMTPYKLALYERQHQMAEFLIKNGAEAHSVMKPKRTSENPDVPESRTEDKGSTSATKEDNENSSSSHTVEETKPEEFLPANNDDGIVPLPTANTELPSSPGPPILHSICSNNGPGGPTGPCPVPPPKLTRSKIRTTLKPYVPPPVLPRVIAAGPPRAISPPHPSCMPPGQPQQVEETKPEEFLPANYDDGIVPLPTANTELPSSPGPPGPPILHSICSNNGPGGPTGPCPVPPPKLTRSKIRTTLKPYVPPPVLPRVIAAGPPRSISPPHPGCMPPGQPQQVEETKPEEFLPANNDDGIVPLPTANTELPSSPGPPGPPILHSICSNNVPGGPTGPCQVPPPKLTRSKIRTTLKPYVPPPLLPRVIAAGPPRSISPPHPGCMPPGQPQQVEETKPEEFLPPNNDDGIVPLPTANTELPSSPGPPGPPILHSICSNNVPGGPTGPCQVPPPKLTRSKIRTTLKPYVPPPVLPRVIAAGPPRSISPPHPRCMPPGQPQQVVETKPEEFLPANNDDGIVPLPTANTELPLSPGPPGPPGPPILHSICSNNDLGGPTGPCPVPPPKLTRSKIRTTLKPYVPPPVLPRVIAAGPPRSISPPHPRCMPPGQPQQVEDTKPEGFLPTNYDDGIVPLPPANTELPSSPDPPRLPGPPLLHSTCSNNVPGGSTGPCTVPPPKLTRSKIRTTLKPYVPPPLQPQDISAGPSCSISLSHPRYKPPVQPHQLKIEIYLVKVEETKPEGLLPANYDDVIVRLPTANTEIPSSPGDTFNPQSANEYFSATNPAEYTHYATHSKVLPLWEATMALLMLTTGIWFLKFVSTVMMWVFNLI